MGDPPLLTLFVVPGESGEPVADTVGHLGEAPLPFDALVVDAADGTDMARLARNAASRFVAVVRAGDRLDPPSLTRRVQALEAHPEPVLALCGVSTTAESDDTIVPMADAGPWGPALVGEDGPQLMDGRAAAGTLLRRGPSGLPTPSMAVIRRSAVPVFSGPSTRKASGDLPASGSRPLTAADTFLAIVLGLFARGPVWWDPTIGVVAPPTSPAIDERRWDEWFEALDMGSALGLLDGLERILALVEHTRRGAGLLRAGITGQAVMGVGGDRGPMLNHPAAVVRRLTTYWREGDPRLRSGSDRLPLAIVVRVEGSVLPTVGELAALAEDTCQVTVVAPTGLRPGELPARVAWVEESAGAVPPPPPGLATLLLMVGERPDVLDRAQLRAFLTRRTAGGVGAEGVHSPVEPPGDGPGEWLSLVTPTGLRPRLWVSTGGPQDNGSGGAGGLRADAVHSLRVVSTAHAGADWMPAPTVEAQGPLRRFVVAAPDYTEGHGGVVAMHRLCDRLNAIGCEAFIEPLGDATGVTRPGWQTPLWRGRSLESAVMIYPEIVTGNPLGASRVVRWLLNRPAWFTGEAMDEHPDDLVVTFDQQIAPFPVLRVPLIDPTRFFPKDVPGEGSALWIGKGTLPVDLDRSDTTLITNSWPATQAEMGTLLRSVDVLYTCDWLTSVVGESLMCGTPAVLVGDQSWSRDEVRMMPGMTWGAEGLDAARRDAGSFFADYFESLQWVDPGVADFVELVNRHFGALEGSPAGLTPPAPA